MKHVMRMPVFLMAMLLAGCGGENFGYAISLNSGSAPLTPLVPIGTPGFGTNALPSAVYLNRPSIIQTDDRLSVYVLDGFGSTIRRIAPNGTTTTLHQEAGISGMAVSPNGEVFFTAAGTVRRLVQPGISEVIAAGLGNPQRMAIDDRGILYVIDGPVVKRITQSGLITPLFQMPVQQPIAAIAAGRDALYIASNASIYRWTEPGRLSLVTTNDAGISDITADVLGDIYFTDYTPSVTDPRFASGTVKQLRRNGDILLIAGSRTYAGYADGPGLAALFNAPSGIAVAVNGIVYVADTLNHVIREISLSGQVRTYAGRGG